MVGLLAEQSNTGQPMTETKTKKASDVLFEHDNPSSSEQPDWLRYSEMATALKNSLMGVLATTHRGSMVVGVEGPWGSGKTTLLGYLRAQLEETPNVILIEVTPWLNGDRQPLAKALLEALSSEVKRQQQQTCIQKLFNRGSPMVKKIRQYASLTARMVSPIAAFGEGWLPWHGLLRKSADLIKNIGNSNTSTQSVAEIKREIGDHLKNSEVSYIVIYDDLDRLEPNEALEVIRVVRGVADFKNTLHILCYDRYILANAVRKGLGLDSLSDGDRYLEKIVQLAVQIPSPEPKLLTHCLIGMVIQVYKDETPGAIVDSKRAAEIRQAIQVWSANLRTPRQVKQIVNQLRFSYKSVQEHVDFADLCTISTLKVLNRELYDWIADFLAHLSYSIGTQTRKIEEEESLRLKRALQAIGMSADCKEELSRLIPSIKWREGNTDISVAFDEPSSRDSQLFFDNCRIGSPYHFRFYFAWTGFSYTVPQEDLEGLKAATKQSWQEALKVIQAIESMPHPGGANWLTVLFDWVARPPFAEQLTLLQSLNLLHAIGTNWDSFLKNCQTSERRGLEQATLFATRQLATSASGRDYRKYIQASEQLLANSKSPYHLIIGLWPTLRSYMKESERRRGDARVLSTATTVAKTSEFIRSEDFVRFLSAWKRLENDFEDLEVSEYSRWFEFKFRTDLGLVETIEKMVSAVPDSGRQAGTATALRTMAKHTLMLLPDPSAVVVRLKRIADTSSHKLFAQASSLLEAIAHGNKTFALENNLADFTGLS